MSKYNQYNWEDVRYRKCDNTTQSDPLTRWILIAILLAVICHIVVLVAMKKMPIFFQSDSADNKITQSVVVRNVEDREYIQTPSEDVPQEEIDAPTATADAFLEELEMLEQIPEDMEMDFSPEVDALEMSVPMEAPAMAGGFDASAMDLTSGMDISEIVEDLGSTDDFIKAAAGQITIDPGKQAADEFDPDLFNVELAKGAGGETRDGVMEGFTPLSEMTRLSQSELAKAKGMIGSDLLFDFNKATLQESAKNSLLKVVLLIDKNPNMKCWIEGHTDLIGSEEDNVKLSIARAEAVRYWLVNSMKIADERLYVIGLGESKPIVLAGDQYEQAINRRVEIKMRNEAPPVINRELETTPEVVRKARIIKPRRNPNLPEAREEPPALPADSSVTDRESEIPALRPLPYVDPYVEPEKAITKEGVVEEVMPEKIPEPVAPRAVPVGETASESIPESPPAPARAIVVEPLLEPVLTPERAVPRAVPVEEPVTPAPVIPERLPIPNTDREPAIDTPPKAIPVE